jgi:hypothetical protein
MYTCHRLKHTLFLSEFHEPRIFSKRFSKRNGQISSFMKICPVEAEGRTDRREEPNSRFSQFRERV